MCLGYILLLALSILMPVVFLAFWITHLMQVNTFSRISGWGSFKDFKREYYSRKWGRDPSYRFSHFCGSSEIHSSIIRFDGVGMKLNIISYIRFSIWVFRNRMKRNQLSFNEIKTK